MFGARYPIVLSPMGGVGTSELAAAVCNAGGLGSLAGAYLSPAAICTQIARVREMTDAAFAVNLFVTRTEPLEQDAGPVLALLGQYHRELGIGAPMIPSPPAEDYDEQVAAVVAARVAVCSFTFGIPSRGQIAALREVGTKLVGTATTVEEVLAVADAGLDAVVVQGAEAGAHRGTFLGRFEDALIPVRELLSQAVKAVAIPVIAAGGIRNGGEIREMLGLGAAAVQIGTAFIPCPESGAAKVYKDLVLAGVGVGETVVTRAFSGRPARGLPNRFIREMEGLGDAVLPFPWQNGATRAMRNAAGRLDRAEFLSLWAGEGTGGDWGDSAAAGGGTGCAICGGVGERRGVMERATVGRWPRMERYAINSGDRVCVGCDGLGARGGLFSAAGQ